MAVRATVVRWVKRVLASRGYSLTRVGHLNRATMVGALGAIAKRQHSVRTVIDVGASDGRWSEAAMAFLPSCQYLLIEAQDVHKKALTDFCNRHSNAQFLLAAAGSARGQVYFKANRPFGGQASYVPFESHNIELSMTTVDHEVRSRRLSRPFLLKLDTHGFEFPILDGAQETLRETEVLIVECYNFKITPECLLFYEMCNCLKEYGFRCVDLADPMHRPYDDAFWQMDLVFVRDDWPGFYYSNYK